MWFRLKIWDELESLKIGMDASKNKGLCEADFQRIALTVAYALVNPSEFICIEHASTLQVTFTVKTEWDIERFGDHINTLKMVGDYPSKVQDEVRRLQQRYKPPTSPGSIEEPTIFVDVFGCIIVWYLPDIFCMARIVSHISFQYY